jgi:hypothetical protein
MNKAVRYRNKYFEAPFTASVPLSTLQILFYLAFHDMQSRIGSVGPPLWSSGQSSWLQVPMPGFDSRHYQKKKVVGLERGPLSLLSSTEELLDRKVAAPV